jgi:hypothetical protein
MKVIPLNNFFCLEVRTKSLAQETEARRSQVKANLGYIARPSLKTKKKESL